jgi:hypothetical protein
MKRWGGTADAGWLFCEATVTASIPSATIDQAEEKRREDHLESDDDRSKRKQRS